MEIDCDVLIIVTGMTKLLKTTCENQTVSTLRRDNNINLF